MRSPAVCAKSSWLPGAPRPAPPSPAIEVPPAPPAPAPDAFGVVESAQADSSNVAAAKAAVRRIIRVLLEDGRRSDGPIVAFLGGRACSRRWRPRKGCRLAFG